MSPSTYSATPPLVGTPEQGTCHICSHRQHRTAGCPGGNSWAAQLAVLGEGTVLLPLNPALATSSPVDSSGTHAVHSKQLWGAESYSLRGGKYFSAGVSLRSSTSSLVNASTSAQDKIGVHGKEHTRVQDHPFQPDSALVHC